MQTYSNLITAIQTFATDHKQINSCVVGEIFEAPEYPLLHGNLVSTSPDENQDVYVFDFFIGTQVVDYANVHEALSDTKLMSNDFVAYMKYAFQVSVPVSMTPAQGSTADNVYGHTFQLTIKLNQGLDLCVVPIEGMVPSYDGGESMAPSGTYSELVELIEQAEDNANTYTDEQIAAIPESGGVWGSITGDIEDQVDLLETIVIKNPYTPSRYFIPSPHGRTESQGAVTSTSSAAVPFRWCFNKTITRVLIEITSAAVGSTSRACIYEAGSAGLPTNLIYDLGQFSSATNGNVVITGLSITLVPTKVYFMVFHTNGASIGIRGIPYFSRLNFIVSTVNSGGAGHFVFTSPGIGVPANPLVMVSATTTDPTYSPTLQFGFF